MIKAGNAPAGLEVVALAEGSGGRLGLNTDSIIVGEATIACQARARTTWILSLAIGGEDNNEYALVVVGELIAWDALDAVESLLRRTEGDSNGGGGCGCRGSDSCQSARPVAHSVGKLEAITALGATLRRGINTHAVWIAIPAESVGDREERPALGAPTDLLGDAVGVNALGIREDYSEFTA